MKTRINVLLVMTVVSFCATTAFFWIFEYDANPQIKSFFDVVWWWVVTSATVGYGDIVPVTWQGRVTAIFAIVSGFFVFANFVAIIAESIHGFFERKIKGTAQIEARNHIVICEYTAIADELIQSLPKCPGFADCEIVIVSNLVPHNPYPQHHFVNGVPINPASLRLANIQYADYVFIFLNLRFADPDVKSMHVASRVLDLNPNATVFMEMLDPQHDLLRFARKKLITMDSRGLIEQILRDKKIDPRQWLESAGKEPG